MAKKETQGAVELTDSPLILLADGTGKKVIFDSSCGELARGKKKVHLPPVENKLLFTLTTHPGELLSIFALNSVLHPDDILPETGHDAYIIREALRPAMSRLRGKLKKVGLGSHLETVRGDGYIFNSQNSHR